jgi:hypothetical protein
MDTFTGYTDNYVKVRTPWDPKLSNKLVYSKLQNIDDEGVYEDRNDYPK